MKKEAGLAQLGLKIDSWPKCVLLAHLGSVEGLLEEHAGLLI